MVKTTFTAPASSLMSAVEAERQVVLAYSPNPVAAHALRTLLALDDRLGETVRTTSEPMLGQIRLKWWQDALVALDSATAPAEPVLEAVQRDVVAYGVGGTSIAPIADAWSEVFAEELDDAALDRFAQRGRLIFDAAGQIAGVEGFEGLYAAGAGWALADLTAGLSDRAEVARVRAAAEKALDQALATPWPRAARALGAAAHLARLDLAGVRPGSARRVARILWHRLTGR